MANAPQPVTGTQAGGSNTNNENTKLLNTNMINKKVNTKVSSKNELLDNFRNFVETYTQIDDIDSKMIEIVNTAFKTYDKFANDIQLEADLRIPDDDFETFCVNNVNDNSQIAISMNDPRLTEYLKIYKDLKAEYLDNCEYLLGLLEKKVLIREKVSDDDTTPHFTLQEINYSELSAIETDVRNRLVNMYSKCHQNYQAGLKALYKALKEPTNES